MISSLPHAYAMLLRVASTAHAPLFGETVSWTDTLLRIEVEMAEAGPRVTQHVCAIAIHDALPIATTTIPDAFVRALPERRYDVSLTPQEDGFRWYADMGTEPVGFDPLVVGSGPLPQRSGDPGVVDWDRDGAPGATVRVKVPFFDEVGIHVVQRAHTVLDGRVGPGGEVQGNVQVRSLEQHVIGAERELFDMSPVVEPNDEASAFWMMPVSSGTTCGEIVADRAGLFGAAPDLE